MHKWWFQGRRHLSASVFKSNIHYAEPQSSPSRMKIKHFWLNLLHTPTKLRHHACGRSWEQLSTPVVTLQNLGFTPPLHSLDQHQKQKDRTLDWPNILISFSSTGNKGMNASTGSIGLPRLINNLVVANDGWVTRYFPHAPRFSQTNLRKIQEQRCDLIWPQVRLLVPPTFTHCKLKDP